ncbi:MAG: hypothetical protein AB2693_31870 [Candidatus Thiodiazotropha sp.]
MAIAHNNGKAIIIAVVAIQVNMSDMPYIYHYLILREKSQFYRFLRISECDITGKCYIDIAIFLSDLYYTAKLAYRGFLSFNAGFSPLVRVTHFTYFELNFLGSKS